MTEDKFKLNGEQKFWLGVWSIVACAFAVLVLATTFGAGYRTYKIAEAVRGGADPQAAACAIRSETSARYNCMVAASKGATK